MINNKISLAAKKRVNLIDNLSHQQYKKYKWGLLSVFLVIALLIFLFNIIYTRNEFLWNNRFFINRLNDESAFERFFITFIYNPISLFVCGIGLVVSGYGLQATNRNGLAGPSTLGLFPLAALGTILSQMITKSFDEIYIGYVFGIGFAFLSLLINFLFLRNSPQKKTFKPILFGFGLGAFITAINILISNLHSSISASTIQLLGSSVVYASSQRFYVGIPVVLICSIIILTQIKRIQIIDTNFYLARSLGVNINFVYWIVAISSSLIAISTTFLIGGLSLIAILIPHLSRIIFKRTNYIFQVFASILITTIFLQSTSLIVEFDSRFNIIFVIATILAIPMIFLVKKELKTK